MTRNFKGLIFSQTASLCEAVKVPKLFESWFSLLANTIVEFMSKISFCHNPIKCVRNTSRKAAKVSHNTITVLYTSSTVVLNLSNAVILMLSSCCGDPHHKLISWLLHNYFMLLLWISDVQDICSATRVDHRPQEPLL